MALRPYSAAPSPSPSAPAPSTRRAPSSTRPSPSTRFVPMPAPRASPRWCSCRRRGLCLATSRAGSNSSSLCPRRKCVLEYQKRKFPFKKGLEKAPERSSKSRLFLIWLGSGAIDAQQAHKGQSKPSLGACLRANSIERPPRIAVKPSLSLISFSLSNKSTNIINPKFDSIFLSFTTFLSLNSLFSTALSAACPSSCSRGTPSSPR